METPYHQGFKNNKKQNRNKPISDFMQWTSFWKKGKFSEWVLKWCFLMTEAWSSRSQQLALGNLSVKMPVEKRPEGKGNMTWAPLRAESSDRRSTWLHQVCAGMCPGVLEKHRGQRGRNEVKGDRRQVREVTGANWCRDFAATVRTLSSERGNKLTEDLGETWQDLQFNVYCRIIGDP